MVMIAMIVVVLVVMVSVSGGDECEYGCNIKTNLLVVSMAGLAKTKNNDNDDDDPEVIMMIAWW